MKQGFHKQQATIATKEGCELQDKAEMSVANLHLEQRVAERTAELHQKNQELSNALEALKKTQAHLVHSEKMAMIGQLAAGMAHEINNPLSYVLSNVELFQKEIVIISQLFQQYQTLLDAAKLLKSDKIQEICQQITTFNEEKKIAVMLAELSDLIAESEEGLLRIKKIVQALKGFSGGDEEKKQTVDINACIESSVEMVWNEIKYTCVLHKQFSTSLPLITGYSNQLKTVFMSLLLNAVEAIKTKGEITVTTLLGDSQIVVRIHDSGCGIEAANLSKIFTPFFTTKPIGTAIGLELAVAYGIIQRHGGTITVESEIDHGSTFTVYLPVDYLK